MKKHTPFSEDYRLRKTPIFASIAILGAYALSQIAIASRENNVYIKPISADITTSAVEIMDDSDHMVSDLQLTAISDASREHHKLEPIVTAAHITEYYLASNEQAVVTAKTILASEEPLTIETEPVAEVIEEPIASNALYSELGIHFNPDDVTEPSNMTLDQIKYFVELRCPAFVGLEDYILSLDSKLNVLFILTVARAETGAGIACVGDNNIFNIRVGSGAYKDYANPKDSLDNFVNLILNDYIHPDGLWHEGTSVTAIGTHYAEPPWAPGILKLAEDILWVLDRDLAV